MSEPGRHPRLGLRLRPHPAPLGRPHGHASLSAATSIPRWSSGATKNLPFADVTRHRALATVAVCGLERSGSCTRSRSSPTFPRTSSTRGSRECLRVLEPGGFLLFSTLGEYYLSLQAPDRVGAADVRERRARRPLRRRRRARASAARTIRRVRHRDTLGAEFELVAFRQPPRTGGTTSTSSASPTVNDAQAAEHARPRTRERLARALAWLERLADRRSARSFCSALALAVYAVRAIGWPLIGRPRPRRVPLRLHPVPRLAPAAALVDALPHAGRRRWSPVLRSTSPAGSSQSRCMAVLFAGSVVAWAAAARAFGARARTPGRGSAARVSRVRLDVPRALERAAVRGGVRALGAARRARALDSRRRGGSLRRPRRRAARARSPGQRRPARLRCSSRSYFRATGARTRRNAAGAFLVAACVPLAAWAVLNGARFGDYTLARGGNAVIPFYRAFITDKIVVARQRPGVAPARQGDPATPADARSVQGVRRDLARGLLERKLPDPRGPLSPLRPGLRLGQQLLRPARGGSRSGARSIRASTRPGCCTRSGSS